MAKHYDMAAAAPSSCSVLLFLLPHSSTAFYNMTKTLQIQDAAALPKAHFILCVPCALQASPQETFQPP